MKRLLVALAMLVPALAHAQDLRDRFNIRLIAQGMYMAEQQSAIPTGYGREAQVASPFELGYGDFRTVIDGRRLPGQFDLHIDARVRLTGQFTTDAATQGANQITARGYDGGREYQVISAWVRRRGESVDFGLGRLIVGEADALRIDGARLWWRMAKHWDLSFYAGAYPDPFSRSLTSDYEGGFAFAGGADTTYTYDKIWGSLSVNSSYLGGKNDGGPLIPTPSTTPGLSTFAPGVFATETPRTWLTWVDYVRLFSWLDLYTDLVLDVTGAAGVQLTRLDVLASARAGQHLTLHAGYDHLSSFAIEMWLTRFLQDRGGYVPGTIENNMIVERTARDEIHGDIDFSFGKASVYADARFRKRALITLSDDPQFAGVNGSQITPGVAFDGTFGLRDRGSVAGVRAGIWGTYLADYRSNSILIGLNLGRSFYDDRLSFDLSFIYADTRDALANNPTAGICTSNSLPIIATPLTYATVNQGCYGTRAGSEYEGGLTVQGQPSSHWFMFLDYRIVADLSGGIIAPGAPTATPPIAPLPQPLILTHVLLLRLEARY